MKRVNLHPLTLSHRRSSGSEQGGPTAEPEPSWATSVPPNSPSTSNFSIRHFSFLTAGPEQRLLSPLLRPNPSALPRPRLSAVTAPTVCRQCPAAAAASRCFPAGQAPGVAPLSCCCSVPLDSQDAWLAVMPSGTVGRIVIQCFERAWAGREVTLL